MENLILLGLISVGSVAFWCIYGNFKLWNDGITQLYYVMGRRPAYPFHTRIFPAFLFYPFKRFWKNTAQFTMRRGEKALGDPFEETFKLPHALILSVRYFSVTCMVFVVFTIGYMYGPFAAALLGMSPYVRHLISDYSHHSDPFALALCVGALLVPVEYGVLIAVVAGMTHERGPVFLAIWTWNPVYLLGLVPILVLRLIFKGGPLMPYEKGIMDTWRTQLHSSISCLRGFPIGALVLPMGAFWAGLSGDWCVIVAVAVGYGQKAVGNDSLRYYGWAIPALIPAIVAAPLHPMWVLLMVFAHSLGHDQLNRTKQ